MEYINNNKAALITVNNKQYRRKAIKTHFVKQGESYINIMQTYALPEYQEGDFISISEKIIALCQDRVVKKEDLKVGFWAKTLSKFASRTSAGVGVGEALKMQYAINKVGLPKILYASVASAVTKLLLVNPGKVLISFKYILFVFLSKKKSTRDNPCPSTALNTLIANFLISS